MRSDRVGGPVTSLDVVSRRGVERHPNHRYTPMEVDGPVPWDMVRGIPALLNDPLSWLEKVVHRYGDLVALPMPRTPVLLVNTPTGVRQVLRDNHANYTKRTVQYGALSLVTGAGLLTGDGELWRGHRRVMQPAFHHGGLDQVAEATVQAADGLRANWSARPIGTAVDVDAATMRATLDVVGRTLFADDLAGRGEAVVAAGEEALRAVLARARSPIANSPIGRLPSPSRRRMRAAVATLDQVCADVVARRRAQGVGERDNDLLAVLLRAGPQMGEREIRDELVTLVIAGHETVASALTWTLHLLAGAPQVQKQVHAELDEVLAPERGSQAPGALRAPRWSDLPTLTWTRAVVDEALRLYPPAWVITRRSIGADRIDGVSIPPGTLVLISPWLLHRREESWPDPLRFDPTRFTNGQQARRREGYLPFGDGPRLCIGRDFALVEATLLVAALLRDRTVRHPEGALEPAVDALVTLRPRGGLPLLLDPR